MAGIAFAAGLKEPLIGVLASALAVWPSMASAACAPAHGAVVFKKCVACHAVDGPKHGAGPSLAGVVGRRSGAAPGFKYSPTLRDLNIVWTPASLDQFLIGPQAYSKETRMAFSGLRDPQARADLICFLQSKS